MALTKAKLIADGVIDVDNLAAGHSITTSNIGEGSNLYYTDARVASYLTTNSYATEGYVTTAVANLVDSAPSTLDTLNELAAALGDDPNFATTVTNSIATKLPLSGGNITGNFTVDTNTLYVDATNNKIGVKTSNINAAVDFQVEGVIASSGAGSKVYTDILENWGNVLTLNSAGGLPTVFQTNGTERMRITSAGNVGIGTNSPTATLEIGDGSATAYQIINSSAGGSITFQKAGTNSAFVGEVEQGLGSGDGLLLYTYSGADRPIRFYPGGSERMRIDSSGNVGIGTTNPLSKLHVLSSASDGQSTGTIIVAKPNYTSGSQKHVHIENTVGTSKYLNIGSYTDIAGVPGTFIDVNADLGLSIQGQGTERVRFGRSGGVSVINGNIGFSNGYGIDFSANGNAAGMTSELLDDYEEGTWTPTIVLGYSNITYGPPTEGNYIKVGNVVHFELRLQITSATATANQIRISLPIQPAATRGGCPALGYCDISNVPSVGIPLLLVGSAGIIFYRNNGSGGAFTGNDANDTSWTVHIGGTYTAA